MEDSWTPSKSRTSPIPPTRRRPPVQVENNPFAAIIDDEDEDDEEQPPIVTPTDTRTRTHANVSSTWFSINSAINSPIPVPINPNVTTRVPAPPPPPPIALALPNNDYDDDFELELLTMPSNTSEIEYFSGVEIKPIPNPDYLTIRKFRNELCNRLADQPYENVEGGLSVIGESADQQRKRRGLAAGTVYVAVVQPTPTLPAAGDADHAAKKLTYAVETSKNKTWVTVRSQGLKHLCVAIPELTAIRDPITKAFPPFVHPRPSFRMVRRPVRRC